MGDEKAPSWTKSLKEKVQYDFFPFGVKQEQDKQLISWTASKPPLELFLIRILKSIEDYKLLLDKYY